MVEHGGQLFVVHCLFLPSESMPRGIRFSVHRLVRRQWVEQSSLDGLAFFVDMAGSALLRARPGQWGEKENHVYLGTALGWMESFPIRGSHRDRADPSGEYNGGLLANTTLDSAMLMLLVQFKKVNSAKVHAAVEARVVCSCPS